MKKTHRVCGPYEVTRADPMPTGAIPVYKASGKTIVYLDPEPKLGPWLNRSRVERSVDGEKLLFRQMASEFDFFPYRFRIRRSLDWRVEVLTHYSGCWLCA